VAGVRYQTQALVLRTAPLGEADRIVTLLAADGRKLRAVARGARKSRRRFLGCLELFSHLDVTVASRPSSQLERLEEAVLRDGHQAIRGELKRFTQACYALELCEAFTVEGDANTGFWKLLADVLGLLDQRALRDVELCYLELRVLQVAGLNPDFSACLGCGRRQSPRWYADRAAAGLYCSDCHQRIGPAHELGQAAVDLLRSLAARRLPAADPPSKLLEQASRLLRQLVDEQAGRVIKSRGQLDLASR